MSRPGYSESIFLNVPLDKKYDCLLNAIIFAVFDCGFVPQCAREEEDSSAVRIQKIYRMIRDSKYGIHDLSRTSLDSKHRLPRFNMPFELGIFLGAKRYGSRKQRLKRALVLERERYRFQIYCSDISGQDIRGHSNRADDAIRSVRNWLRTCPEMKSKLMPDAEFMCVRYRAFKSQLPRLRRQLRLDRGPLHIVDYYNLVSGWLKKNPK